MTDLPCESRPAARCTYELTTGAPWDRTLNKCFMDADGACRWSDECTRIDGAAASDQRRKNRIEKKKETTTKTKEKKKNKQYEEEKEE